jgi:cytochrome P450
MAALIQRPPGPPRVSANPLSLFSYMQRMRREPVTRVQERFERFGDIYYAPFLKRDVYVLRHPEHVHEVLITQASKFEKPSEGLTATQLRRLLGEGLLNSNGELWRRQRRLIQPAFRRERLEEYAGLIVEHSEAMLSGWRDGGEIDASREMMELTLRIVSSALFDHQVTDESDRVAAAMRVFRSSFGGIDSVLPDWLPTPGKRRAQRVRDNIDEIVYALIDRPGAAQRHDLSSTLSQALDEQGDGQGMSRRQLRDELLTLFIAGHETTSHALSWTWHLLARHPDVASKLQREIEGVLAGRAPTLPDLLRMPYLEQVLSESMRLFPPAYVLARVAIEDARIGGYLVPKGADVVIWIYHVHHDARWFPDPERFEPERFEPARRKQLPQSAYLPFGAGTRSCIGKQFAMFEAQLVLACVARRFSLEALSAAPVQRDMAITLAPRGGLRMRVRARGLQSVAAPAAGLAQSS